MDGTNRVTNVAFSELLRRGPLVAIFGTSDANFRTANFRLSARLRDDFRNFPRKGCVTAAAKIPRPEMEGSISGLAFWLNCG